MTASYADEIFEFHDGYLSGPHPADAFIGSPYNDEKGSYGCYAPVIALAMERAAGEDYRFTARRDSARGNAVGGVHRQGYARGILGDAEYGAFFFGRDLAAAGTGAENSSGWNHQHCVLLVGCDRKAVLFSTIAG